MNVAITGANGFVGQYLINRLLERGDQVLAIAWVQDPFRDADDPRVKRHLTDFSREDLTAALAGVDAVVHLSAMRTNAPSDARGIHPYYEANVRSTENIFLAARDLSISRICQASSIAVYSNENTVPYRDDQNPIPLSFYGVSKLACENLAAIYARQFPVKIVSLRFAQIFGYGEIRGLALTKFIELARLKQPLTVWGEGQSARDYIYVKDIVSAIEAAITAGGRGGAFNIGSGQAYTVREIAETINTVFENPTPIHYDLSKPDSADAYFMDISSAKDQLGWQPSWSLQAAVEDMRSCYESR